MDVRVQSADLGRAIADLKKVDRELARSMTRRLREGVKPVVADVKAAYLGMPVKGGKSTGLRRALARATQAQVRTSRRGARVSVRVNSDRLPAGQRNLARALERATFRHPVHGDQEVWVVQKGGPVAEPVVRRHDARMTRVAHEVLDDVVTTLAKH